MGFGGSAIHHEKHRYTHFLVISHTNFWYTSIFFGSNLLTMLVCVYVYYILHTLFSLLNQHNIINYVYIKKKQILLINTIFLILFSLNRYYMLVFMYTVELCVKYKNLLSCVKIILKAIYTPQYLRFICVMR